VKIILNVHYLPRICAVARICRIVTIAAGLAAYSAWAQINPCDLNGDGAVDINDVQLAVNMSIGAAPCSANVVGPSVCNVILVQRVVNAALGQACVTGSGHSATLTWVASPSTNLSGYNVYRGTSSGGPYTLLTASPISAVTYNDGTVQAGQTYYFVVKAVGSDGSLSAPSNESTAVIPSP